MFFDLEKLQRKIKDWEIEGSLNAYILHLNKEGKDIKVGQFIMKGVVNVDSRIKTESLWSSINAWQKFVGKLLGPA